MVSIVTWSQLTRNQVPRVDWLLTLRDPGMYRLEIGLRLAVIGQGDSRDVNRNVICPTLTHHDLQVGFRIADGVGSSCHILWKRNINMLSNVKNTLTGVFFQMRCMIMKSAHTRQVQFHSAVVTLPSSYAIWQIFTQYYPYCLRYLRVRFIHIWVFPISGFYYADIIDCFIDFLSIMSPYSYDRETPRTLL